MKKNYREYNIHQLTHFKQDLERIAG